MDEAVLALLHLNAFEDHGQVRSWKTFDWDAMDRLHERGLIGDPKSKAKSVPLTAIDVAAAKESFRRRFAARRTSPEKALKNGPETVPDNHARTADLTETP